jgi:hypothetical protein
VPYRVGQKAVEGELIERMDRSMLRLGHMYSEYEIVQLWRNWSDSFDHLTYISVAV